MEKSCTKYEKDEIMYTKYEKDEIQNFDHETLQ